MFNVHRLDACLLAQLYRALPQVDGIGGGRPAEEVFDDHRLVGFQQERPRVGGIVELVVGDDLRLLVVAGGLTIVVLLLCEEREVERRLVLVGHMALGLHLDGVDARLCGHDGQVEGSAALGVLHGGLRLHLHGSAGCYFLGVVERARHGAGVVGKLCGYEGVVGLVEHGEHRVAGGGVGSGGGNVGGHRQLAEEGHEGVALVVARAFVGSEQL